MHLAPEIGTPEIGTPEIDIAEIIFCEDDSTEISSFERDSP